MYVKAEEGCSIRAENASEKLAIVEIVEAADEHLDLSEYSHEKAATVQRVMDTIRDEIK